MNNVKSHLFAGFIIGSIMILLNVIFIIFNLEGNTKITWISSVVNMAMLIYFIYDYGRNNDNTKAFGELFSYGFKATALVTIILTMFMIAYSYIFPESESKAMEIAREKMLQDERMTDDMIEQALDVTRKFYFPILIAGTIFATMVVGAVGSLIGAAITRKTETTPFGKS
ncbi:MAG: DUF4199 domain-containing protein [Chitinophagia bacterium]